MRVFRFFVLFGFAASVLASSGHGIRLKAMVEGKDLQRGTLTVDSFVVHPGRRISGAARELKDVRLGDYAVVFGTVQKDGTLKARSLSIRRNPPGNSFKKRLFRQSDAESDKIQKSGKIYKGDPAVTAYVQKLGQSLVPDYARDKFDFQFSVINDKNVNAFAFPNGHIYVYTGLLGRVDNEAQLATILGHEITHVTERHGQRNMKSSIWKYAGYLVSSAVIANQLDKRGASQLEGYVVGIALNLGFMAAVNGYGRNMEDQADRIGLRYAEENGFDPREGPKVWDMFNAVYGDTPTALNVFYGNHSTNKRRKRNQNYELATHYQQLPSAESASLKVDAADYQARMVKLIRSTAVADFEQERYTAAENEFKRVLNVKPDDKVAMHHLEKIGVLRAQKNDKKKKK